MTRLHSSFDNPRNIKIGSRCLYYYTYTYKKKSQTTLLFFSILPCLYACFFSLACSLSLSLSSHSPRICTLVLSRSFVVSERYCDKYLSRRRATLIRKKSKKPIVYLSFSSFDCLLTACLHYINITTITDNNKQNKQKK